MKEGTTIQERLWELRKDKGLNLEQLSEATGISKSALGSYEKDDYKEINHGSLVTLAKFYGVSTDYLLCLTENRSHPDTELPELHLSDDMIALLKNGRINNRLLCEIVTHKEFPALMADTEIYVDGIAAMRFQDLNSVLEMVREEVLAKYQPENEDTTLKTLRAAQIKEEDYFCHVTHRTWDAILHDIRVAHKNDAESVSDESNAAKLHNDIRQAMRVPGTHLDMFCHIMCSQLQIKYEKLSEQERSSLKKILQKSGVYKNSPPGRRKKR